MRSKQNQLNSLLLTFIGLGIILGCSLPSKEETEAWRKKELKEQETRKDLMTRSEEFFKFKAPEKLVNEPYVKAPVVIVWKWADGKTEILENNIHRITDHAQAAEDAKSIYKVSCSEIPAGFYGYDEADEKKVPAFSSKCETELYDKSIPALIYKKTFENTKLAETVKAGRFTGKMPEKVVADVPQKEIENFVYFLERK
jgi:actin-related protein